MTFDLNADLAPLVVFAFALVVLWIVSRPTRAPKHKRQVHLILESRNADMLDQFSAAGWRIAAVVGTELILARDATDLDEEP